MSEASRAQQPERERFQWRISTWLVLVAILGWVLIIRPPMIERTRVEALPNGAWHTFIDMNPNPHYLGPFVAFVVFALAKDVARWRAKRRTAARP